MCFVWLPSVRQLDCNPSIETWAERQAVLSSLLSLLGLWPLLEAKSELILLLNMLARAALLN